jgi:CelD/BcsL family acetyltransferase involved in cellulose biosynthesis
LLDSSRTTQTLKELSALAKLNFDLEPLPPSPYIEITASFEDYVDSLNAKQAHEMRRKLRRVARNPESIAMEIVADNGQLDQALDDFFRLMSQEADKAAFLKPAMRVQMEAIAQSAFAGGWLQLAFLKCGDRRIAGYMNFDYDNCIWAYNAGFDNEYAYLSPGWIILAEMMKWNIEHGRRVFDFMRGDEEYKYRFGGKDRFVQKAVISK